MTRLFHPPELERSRQQDQFDPVVEGARYRLSREVSLAIWGRVCADETDRTSRFDAVQAQRRFREMAARIAARGGWLHSDVGRLTRVQIEIAGVPHDARPSAPGRQTLVGNMPSPRLGFEDYRVLGLKGVLQRLGPEHPLRPELIAAAAIADRSIAGRATLWREPLPRATTSNGRALWHAAERHAATLYRRATQEGVVDEHDPAVESALQRRGTGQPLPAQLRRDMERALGVSLAGVRIHTDAIAAQAARALSAEAFTVGEDIFFSGGSFAPDTRSGRRLLVHELTHVAQALRGSAGPAGGGLLVSQPGDPREREADAVAERIDDTAARQAPVSPAIQGPAAASSLAGTPLLFRAPAPAPNGTPIQVDASTFEGAAQGMADILQSNGFSDPARIIIVNGANVRVFDATGKPVGSGKTYRLKTNALLPPGVFRMAGKSRTLRIIKIDDTGRAFLGGTLGVAIDFGKDFDDQAGFNQDVAVGVHYYVSPQVMLPQVDPKDPPPPPPRTSRSS
jgi:hypothetical protein